MAKSVESNSSINDDSSFVIPKDTLKVTEINQWQDRRQRILSPYRKLDTALGLVEEEKSDQTYSLNTRKNRHHVEYEFPEVVCS